MFAPHDEALHALTYKAPPLWVPGCLACEEVMLPHVDPVFYQENGFCRMEFGLCGECDRLDELDRRAGITHPEVMANAIALVVAALRREG